MRLRWIGWAAALALSAPVFAAAQNAAKPELTGVAHVAVRTNDMQAELAFLSKLGFEKAFTIEQEGKVGFYIVKVNDREFLEVVPKGNADSKLPTLGFDHICFETNDVNALHQIWADKGLSPTDVTNGPDATREFGAKDPEGRVTEALEFVPGSMAMKDLGQHLGAVQVSKVLMGVDLPVADVAATKKFYESVGFTASGSGSEVRLSSPGHAGLRMVLRPLAAGVKPQVLFAVDNAGKAADTLTGAGLKVERGKKKATVLDPEGNVFVMLETAVQ